MLMRFDFLIVLGLVMIVFAGPNAAAACTSEGGVTVCDDANENGVPDYVGADGGAASASYEEVPERCSWFSCTGPDTAISADAAAEDADAYARTECTQQPGHEEFACGDYYDVDACTERGWHCTGIWVSVWKYQYMTDPNCIINVPQAGQTVYCSSIIP